MIHFKPLNKLSFLTKIPLILLPLTATALADLEGKKIFKLNCVACHQVENTKKPIVGPSLVEINHYYKKDVAAFVKWCNKPGKKRKNAIQMPTMVHVGNENLEKIHAWMLEVTKGKKFKAKKKKRVDPLGYSKRVKGPAIQRIFMENSSPASIAVTVDGQHSLCWDTVSCRLRYIWKGGFIDGYPYWVGNGKTLAVINGEIYYRAPKKLDSGITNGDSSDKPKFKGYRVVKDLPVFSYSIGKLNVTESILNDNGSLAIVVKIDTEKGIQKNVSYPLGNLAQTSIEVSAGKIQDGTLVLTPKEATNFTITFNQKK